MLFIRTDVKDKDEYNCVIRKVKKMNNSYVSVNIFMNDFYKIFNYYISKEKGINLFGYDILVTYKENIIELDMTILKEDWPAEHKYIINELKNLFGRTVIKTSDKDSSIYLLNLKVILRTMFNKASYYNVENNIITIEFSSEDLNGNTLFERCVLLEE